MTVHILVSGRVQGVSYRAWCLGRARDLGLRGWVRNLDDGRVELLATGEPEALNALSNELYQGSPLARVDGVEVREVSTHLDELHFNVLNTARSIWSEE